MDETLMTYLRNIISLEQARYVQGQLLQQLHAAAVPPRDKPLRLLLYCVWMCDKMKGNRPGGRDLQEECT